MYQGVCVCGDGCWGGGEKSHIICNASVNRKIMHDNIISESESELLLVTRSNDNHSPGPVMREVSP